MMYGIKYTRVFIIIQNDRKFFLNNTQYNINVIINKICL